jgi:hypothetical protein
MKDILKSKFTATGTIPDKIEPEKVEKFDPRPLHVRLAEARQIEEEGMNQLFRLANRVRKLNQDEIQFYNELESKTSSKEEAIRKSDQEELEKFRILSQQKEKTETIPVFNKTAIRNVQREILNSAVIVKKPKQQNTINNINQDMQNTINDHKKDIDQSLDGKQPIKKQKMASSKEIAAEVKAVKVPLKLVEYASDSNSDEN